MLSLTGVCGEVFKYLKEVFVTTLVSALCDRLLILLRFAK